VGPTCHLLLSWLPSTNSAKEPRRQPGWSAGDMRRRESPQAREARGQEEPPSREAHRGGAWPSAMATRQGEDRRAPCWGRPPRRVAVTPTPRTAAAAGRVIAPGSPHAGRVAVRPTALGDSQIRGGAPPRRATREGRDAGECRVGSWWRRREEQGRNSWSHGGNSVEENR
jgi:hypothetical protein